VVTDLSKNFDPDDDYPDISIEVAQRVVKEKALGILICGSGAGVTITANKVDGIRAALAMNKKTS